MRLKKFFACAAAVVIAASFAACGNSDDSSKNEGSKSSVSDSEISSAAEKTENTDSDSVGASSDVASKTENPEDSASSDAADTEDKTETGSGSSSEEDTDKNNGESAELYDVKEGERQYDKLFETYANSYTIELTAELSGQECEMNFTKSGDQAYNSVVISGMKSYTVLPGDGIVYSVSEATTTYTTADETEQMLVSADFLFGTPGEFIGAEKDEKSGEVSEHFALNMDIFDSEGEIVFVFSGDKNELTKVIVSAEGVETNYTVKSLSKADESLVAMPDLSAYTDATA
ncbi:MAG: hypothetical protein J5994_07245 [Ruminococcus sp.]|nr:hypothetical protein [Ruminococcus sp.]